MSKTAAEVIEEIFNAAEADPASAAVAGSLRGLWDSDSWSDQQIEAALRASEQQQ